MCPLPHRMQPAQLWKVDDLGGGGVVALQALGVPGYPYLSAFPDGGVKAHGTSTGPCECNPGCHLCLALLYDVLLLLHARACSHPQYPQFPATLVYGRQHTRMPFALNGNMPVVAHPRPPLLHFCS